MTLRTLLATAAVCAVGVAGAAERITMKVYQGGELVLTHEVSNDTELTFSGKSFFISSPGDNSGALDLTNDTEIEFNVPNNGVVATVGNDEKLSLRTNPVRSTLELNGPVDSLATLSIYAIHGGHILSIPEWQGEPVDVTSLAPGMYILKINNQTIKFIKL